MKPELSLAINRFSALAFDLGRPTIDSLGVAFQLQVLLAEIIPGLEQDSTSLATRARAEQERVRIEKEDEERRRSRFVPVMEIPITPIQMKPWEDVRTMPSAKEPPDHRVRSGLAASVNVPDVPIIGGR